MIWSYNKNLSTTHVEFINVNKIKYTSKIYDQEYILDKDTSKIYDQEYILDKKLESIKKLIILMVEDIIISKSCDKNMIEFFITNITNKSIFVNTMTIIKNLD